MRVAEPTKLCTKCGQRKPWSMFHAKAKWGDGTMRQPAAYCKDCQREYVRVWHRERRCNDPEWARRRDHSRYESLRSDPERWAADLARRREWKREREGYRRDLRKPAVRTSCLVPAGPFVAWLRDVMARDEATIVALAERFGIQDRRLREILNGQPTVELATVERALIAEGVETLMDLYPGLYEESA